MTTTPPAPSGELAELLPAIQRLVRRRLRSGVAPPRLRGAQVELLRLVAARPGLRVSEAAQELFLADNSVSTLVNQLGRAGLLRRETDPSDGRAARLHAEPEAIARLAAWDARRGALFAEQLGRLDAADHEALAAALPVLRRLAEGLRSETPPPSPESGASTSAAVTTAVSAEPGAESGAKVGAKVGVETPAEEATR